MAPRAPFSAVLFLVCAFCCQIFSGSFLANDFSEPMLIRLIPERLRSFVAARLWEQADRYMHTGPSRLEGQNFIAGSYAGNTDLLPLMHAVTALVPHELPPWQLLAANLGLHLSRKDEAIRILQHAISLNADNPEIHELYATIASLRMFAGEPDRDEKNSALKYLQTAINKFVFSQRSIDDHAPAMNLRSYFILRSRLEVELGYPRAALESWEKSGVPLQHDQGRLASMLILYRDRGILPDPAEFKKNTVIEEKPVDAALAVTTGQNPSPQMPQQMPKPPLFRSRFSLLAAFVSCLLIFCLRLIMFRRK